MAFLFGHFLRRLTREGTKSLAVPMLALVLVVLINLLGAVKVWLEDQYEDVMDNFEIVVELSDLTGYVTDGLQIDEKYINLFTDPDATLSLQRYTSGLVLRRELDVGISGRPDDAVLTGVNTDGAAKLLEQNPDVEITFSEGYDRNILDSEEPVCLVSMDLLEFAKTGALDIAIKVKQPDETVSFIDPELNKGLVKRGDYYFMLYPGGLTVRTEPVYSYKVVEGETISVESKLAVVGTASGVSCAVYCPFKTANALGAEIESFQPYTEQLSMTLAENRSLDSFKQQAALSFPRVKPIYDSRPFAMTIYDSVFYETLEPIRQNIILVDVATPFLFALSVCVGFVASVLMARRRKPEFALMRCAGIRKWDIFFCSLAEQAILSFVGAALGCALIAATWGYFSIERPGIFLACYIIGTVFSSARAAGTNVLKILHEKE